MSNCHLSRTSLVSLLEITTTSRWTRHSKSHSKKSKKLVSWILQTRNCQIHGHLVYHTCINRQTMAYLTDCGLICQVTEKIQNTQQHSYLSPGVVGSFYIILLCLTMWDEGFGSNGLPQTFKINWKISWGQLKNIIPVAIRQVSLLFMWSHSGIQRQLNEIPWAASSWSQTLGAYLILNEF